jgi:hypothetical protein
LAERELQTLLPYVDVLRLREAAKTRIPILLAGNTAASMVAVRCPPLVPEGKDVFRSIHHSISPEGLTAEVQLAKGGVLLLEDVDLFPAHVVRELEKIAPSFGYWLMATVNERYRTEAVRALKFQEIRVLQAIRVP